MPRGVHLTTRQRYRLKQERERRLLSLEEAAKKGGIHAVTLSRWETGTTLPSRTKLSYYLRSLGLSRTEIASYVKE